MFFVAAAIADTTATGSLTGPRTRLSNDFAPKNYGARRKEEIIWNLRQDSPQLGKDLVELTLCSRHDSRVQRLPIDIVATKHICNEYSMEVRFFQHSCQFNPVINVCKTPRTIFWMSPETWRLMPTAYTLVSDLDFSRIITLLHNLHISTKAFTINCFFPAAFLFCSDILT